MGEKEQIQMGGEVKNNWKEESERKCNQDMLPEGKKSIVNKKKK